MEPKEAQGSAFGSDLVKMDACWAELTGAPEGSGKADIPSTEAGRGWTDPLLFTVVACPYFHNKQHQTVPAGTGRCSTTRS